MLTLQGRVIGGVYGVVVVLLIRVDQHVPIVDQLWLGYDGDMTLILLGHKV